MSLHNFLLLHLRSYFQNSSSCFIGVSKHLATIKALGLRPRAFICFSVFGYPDETLALVLEIVHETLSLVFDMKKQKGSMGWGEGGGGLFSRFFCKGRPS